MSDSYQAIYDAVRSRISNGDIGQAVRDVAFQQFDISNQIYQLSQDAASTLAEQRRPSVLFRPKIYMDGNQWCALYGDNIQDGVAGFGDSPAWAMYDFDKNWDAPKGAAK